MTPMPPTPKKSPEPWEAVFLETLAKTCNVRLACATAGKDRSDAYKRRRNDPEFAERWDDAIDAGVDILAAEARRRAAEGVKKGVWFKGQKVGEETEYSDVLLMFLLKAHRPEVYRDNFDMKKAVDGIGDRSDR